MIRKLYRPNKIKIINLIVYFLFFNFIIHLTAVSQINTSYKFKGIIFSNLNSELMRIYSPSLMTSEIPGYGKSNPINLSDLKANNNNLYFQNIFDRYLYLDWRTGIGLRIIKQNIESQVSLSTIINQYYPYGSLQYDYNHKFIKSSQILGISGQYKFISHNQSQVFLGTLIQIEKYRSSIRSNLSVFDFNNSNIFQLAIYPEFRYNLFEYFEFNLRIYPCLTFSTASGNGFYSKKSGTTLSYRSSVGIGIKL